MKIREGSVEVVHESPNSIYGQFRREEADREQKQHDIELDAQNRLLDENLSFAEWNRRREAMRFLVADPTVPIEDATMTDYDKRRRYDEAPVTRPPLRVGALSVDDYINARVKELRRGS